MVFATQPRDRDRKLPIVTVWSSDGAMTMDVWTGLEVSRKLEAWATLLFVSGSAPCPTNMSGWHCCHRYQTAGANSVPNTIFFQPRRVAWASSLRLSRTRSASERFWEESLALPAAPISIMKLRESTTAKETEMSDGTDHLSRSEIDRIIMMAWEDRTSFDAIRLQFGLSPGDVIKLMRREMKPRSFKMWRKRTGGRVTKHEAKFAATDGGDEPRRFRSKSQRG